MSLLPQPEVVVKPLETLYVAISVKSLIEDFFLSLAEPSGLVTSYAFYLYR